MLFHIITLGCKINQYESQAIAESLEKRGFKHAADPALAQAIIINSCAVTSRAVRDLKKTCRQVSRSNPRARIIITGCAAQVLEKELSQLRLRRPGSGEGAFPAQGSSHGHSPER